MRGGGIAKLRKKSMQYWLYIDGCVAAKRVILKRAKNTLQKCNNADAEKQNRVDVILREMVVEK